MSIIIAIMVFGALVFIHESGHYFAAKWCGVMIEKFSIGFGPKILGFKRNGTEYILSLIPLGGYVKMKGENPYDKDQKGDQDEFAQKTWYQRAFIAFAGPFANLIFAFVLFIFSFAIGKTYFDMDPIIEKATSEYASYLHENDKILQINHKVVNGYSEMFLLINENKNNIFKIQNNQIIKEINIPIKTRSDFYSNVYPKSGTIIGDVASGMPAWKAGLKSMDSIMKIDGLTVDSWTKVRETIQNSKNKSVLLTINRNDHIFDKTVILETNPLEEKAVKMIGITQYLPVKIEEKNNILESIKLGSISTINFTVFNYLALYKVFKSPSSLKASLGGPVMVFSMTKETAEKGFSDTINFMAAISILLMIMNLLPIPILDGGHIFFCLIEGLFKRQIPLKIQQNLQQVGFFLLIFLMVFAFYNDFSKMATRSISMKENQKIIDTP